MKLCVSELYRVMIEAVEGNLNISCNILQEIVYSETRKACSTYWVKFHSKYGGVDISMNTMLLIAVVAVSYTHLTLPTICSV